MKKSDLEAAARIIDGAGSFLVMGHINPDGDSLGSLSAMGLALDQTGKSYVLISPDGVPDIYKFLPGSDRILQSVPDGMKFDVCLIVDCENLTRLGPASQYLSDCSTVIEIDHHPGRDRSHGINLLNPASASSGEIVYSLLKELDMNITSDIADCLLTAMVTDTGSFRFSNVKPDTFRTAADLVEAGGSTSKVSQKVYDTRSLPSIKLLGFALSNLQVTYGGQVAYSYISTEDITAATASDSETEGIVNYMRSVRGARVGILFTEGSDGVTRVSLRARDGVDVSRIAREFGGGGHKSAAGVTIDRPLGEAMKLVLDAVVKWMES